MIQPPLALALPVLLALPALFQDARHPIPPAPGSEPQIRTPDGGLVASDPAGLLEPPPEVLDPVTLNREGGPVPILDVVLPDGVPAPRRALHAPGANGDVLVAAPSGDPFFLSSSAGPYFPPPGEALDPQLALEAGLGQVDARPDEVVYGYAMLQRRITPQRVAQLEALGCRVLGFRPHNNLAVAVQRAAVASVASHPDLRWLGFARPWQKVHPALASELASSTSGAPLTLWVSLFESDRNFATVETPFGQVHPIGPGPAVPSPENPDPRPVRTRTNGWQEQALEAGGAVVLEYVPRPPAFLIELPAREVESLVGLDFVQSVELQIAAELAHDESTPMIHGDYGRLFFNGGTNQVAVAGQVDSGIQVTHEDLNHFYGVGWNVASGGNGNPWQDPCFHGTHVAGTILGNGDVDAGHAGNAPGLGWGGTGRFFNIRFDGSGCALGHTWTTWDLIQIMRLPALTTPRPHVINNSWGGAVSPGVSFDGTELDATQLDAAVYGDDQLWIFAAGNEGPGPQTVRVHGVAKNVLTVGNVADFDDGGGAGEIVAGSSRGPAKDGRWKPNVCAPGWAITSASHTNNQGYRVLGGTSMATPHVTGLAAQLVDAYSFLRYAPARLSSLLMATAQTRYDLPLGSPADAHLDSYGTGRVDGMRAMHASSQFGWTNWGFTLNSGQGTFADFTVNPGATRLIVCMHYVEPPAGVGSGRALVSDFDLFLDQAPIDPALNTGEWFAQQSGLDNTEIRILNNPQVGAWRWKIWPYSTYNSAKFGLTVAVIYGDTTPDGSLVVNASKPFVKPFETVDVTATASNPDYIASAVLLDSTLTSGTAIASATTTLLDGRVTQLTDNPTGGREVMLGNIRNGTSRSARWTAFWATEGWKSWRVDARSENWVDKNATLNIGVDGTSPTAPSGILSTSHTVGVWNSSNSVAIQWTEPFDLIAGVGGYGWSTTLGAPGTPPAVQVLPATTTLNASLPTSASGQYINLRAVDRADNWGPAGSIGPFLIDSIAPVPGATLVSSTHSTGVNSCRTPITMNWTAASDLHSGLGGYIGLWDFTPGTNPTGATNISATRIQQTYVLPGSTQARWFHLRPVDQAGNLGPTRHAGPYYLEDQPASTYCTAKVNSRGCVPTISFTGRTGGGTLRVLASQVINNKNGILFWGRQPNQAPFQGGYLCVKSPLKRTPLQNSGGNPPPNDCSGTYSFHFSSAYLASQGLAAGDVVYCQYWYRDPQVQSTTGLSDALRFTVCP